MNRLVVLSTLFDLNYFRILFCWQLMYLYLRIIVSLWKFSISCGLHMLRFQTIWQSNFCYSFVISLYLWHLSHSVFSSGSNTWIFSCCCCGLSITAVSIPSFCVWIVTISDFHCEVEWFQLSTVFAGATDKPVSGILGGDATLSCECDATDILSIELSRIKIIFSCRNETCDAESDSQNGRVFKEGVCGFVIKGLRLSDAGKYILRVYYLDDPTLQRTYQLCIQCNNKTDQIISMNLSIL